jgi:hypothetical protein
VPAEEAGFDMAAGAYAEKRARVMLPRTVRRGEGVGIF